MIEQFDRVRRKDEALLKQYGHRIEPWVRRIKQQPLLRPLWRLGRKAALLPLLLPLLALVIAKGYLHLSAYQLLDQAQAALPDTVEFEYQDLDSSFDGRIELSGASLMFEGMSLPLHFQQLTLQSDSWQQYVDQAEQLEDGMLPFQGRLQFSALETELQHLAAANWLPMDTIRHLLGCSKVASASGDSNSEVLFNGSLAYGFSPESEYLNLELALEQAERYRLQARVDLDLATAEPMLVSLNPRQVGLGGAQLSLFNLGGQSELLQRCGATGRSGLVEGRYVAHQSKVVKHSLLQQGWWSSDELELAYQDYLFFPVEARFSLHAPRAVKLDQLQQHSDWSAFNTQVGLNTYQGGLNNLRWQPEANQLAAAPVQPAVIAAKVTPTVRDNALPQPGSAEQDKRQQQPVISPTVQYQPAYKTVSVRQLGGLLGAPLKLTTHNGRKMEGILESLARDQLQLRREMSYGVAVVPVRLDIISTMQAYF